MEHYDTIFALLDSLRDHPSDTAQLAQLESLIEPGNAREIHLVFQDWISRGKNFTSQVFTTLTPILVKMLAFLNGGNQLILSDFVESLFRAFGEYTTEEKSAISHCWNEVNAPQDLFTYWQLKFMFSPQPDTGALERIEPPTIAFSKMSDFQKLLYSRCSIADHQKFAKISYTDAVMHLIKSKQTNLMREGILQAEKVTSSKQQLFRAIVCAGPSLESHDEAIESWEVAKRVLRQCNDVDRFNIMTETLQDGELSDSARTVIVQEIMHEMGQQKNGIFRSPVLSSILFLVLPDFFADNPTTKTEGLVTGLNFLRLLLCLDRKHRCYRVFGTEEGLSNIQGILRKIKAGIQKAEKNNKRPPSKILAEMKKTNFGENFTLEDVQQSIQSSQLSILRVQFAANIIERILQNKE